MKNNQLNNINNNSNINNNNNNVLAHSKDFTLKPCRLVHVLVSLFSQLKYASRLLWKPLKQDDWTGFSFKIVDLI